MYFWTKKKWNEYLTKKEAAHFRVVFQNKKGSFNSFLKGIKDEKTKSIKVLAKTK